MLLFYLVVMNTTHQKGTYFNQARCIKDQTFSCHFSFPFQDLYHPSSFFAFNQHPLFVILLICAHSGDTRKHCASLFPFCKQQKLTKRKASLARWCQIFFPSIAVLEPINVLSEIRKFLRVYQISVHRSLFLA